MLSNPILLVVAIVIAALTGVVSYYALRDHSIFRTPGIIAACVAILVLIGMLNMGEGMIHAMLLPYVALGITILLLLLALLLMKVLQKSKGRRVQKSRPKQDYDDLARACPAGA